MDAQDAKKLHAMFPSMEASIIGHVLQANSNSFDKALDELLTMQADPLAASRVANPAVVRPAPAPVAPQPRPGISVDDSRHIQNLGNIFGQDLSVSVITTVFKQEQGDLQRTVDTLINIQQDQEAIAQIRQLNREQQQKYELQMQAEREKQIKEREKAIAQQVEEQKRRLESLLKIKEEELKRREQERAERERLAKELEDSEKKKALEEAERKRKEAEEAARLKKEQDAARLAEQEKLNLQAEADRAAAALAAAQRAAKEAELAAERQRQAEAEAEAERMRRQSEKEAMSKKVAELDERLKEQEKELLEKEEEIKQNQAILKQREEENERLRKEAEICTLAVQYSQKQKEIIVVYSMTKQKPNKSDWVGFFKVGSNNKKYLKYIATNGSSVGHEAFETPKVPGLYEFRFFLAGTYEDVARSDAIFIGPQLEMQSEFLEADNKIRLTWNLKSGELGSSDWVGFYRRDKSNKNYISSHYLDAKASNGCIEVPAPRRPDDYEFRFLPYACGYQHICTSNVVVVPNKDVVTMEEIRSSSDNSLQSLRLTWNILSVDVSSWDWVALYKDGAANNCYETYKYVDTKAGSLIFEAPRTPGKYQLRYHSKSQRRSRHVATTSVFEVEDRDQVTANFDGGYVKVEWSIHSVDTSASDWVGIYRVGETNNKSYVDYKYIDPRVGFVLFNRPDSNNYEVRFFSATKPKYEDLKRSAPLYIP